MPVTQNELLLLSVALRLLGFGCSLVLLYRARDRRFAFMSLLLLLMAVRQILTMLRIELGIAELPALFVSALGVFLVYYFYKYTRQELRLQQTLKEHNDELRAHRNRLRATLGASPDFIFVFDADCRYEEILSGRDRITIRDPDAFIGRTPNQILPDEAADVVNDAIIETLRTGELQTVEYRLPLDDGFAWYEGRTAIIDYPEASDKVLFSARDITERKDRERQLQVLDRVLRHNIRNDMTVIRGKASVIERRASGDIADAAETMIRRSEALVNVAEKEREIVELLVDSPPVEQHNVPEIVERRAATVAESYPSAEVDVTLPESATALAVEHIGRAVEELVENAVVHSDAERPTADILVEKRGESVAIQVSDNGPGIPEQERNVLLENRETDSLYHGSGMGLWLVRWIVRLSGGDVSFEDRDDFDTTVEITLSKD